MLIFIDVNNNIYIENDTYINGKFISVNINSKYTRDVLGTGYAAERSKQCPGKGRYGRKKKAVM